MKRSDRRLPAPEELPDYVNVKLRDGRVAKCQVTGKRLRWPLVQLPDGGSVEVAPETLVSVAARDAELFV